MKWLLQLLLGDQNDDTLCEEIKSLCRKHLGTYKVPKKIFFANELPKTHVGKIDKKKLLDLYEV